jgi:leucine-rich repeat protein SHOC2
MEESLFDRPEFSPDEYIRGGRAWSMGAKLEVFYNPDNLPVKLSDIEEIIDRAKRNRASGLYLDNCHLTTLPDSIGRLTDLKALSLRGNRFSSIPKIITRLYLHYLDLDSNPLRDLSVLKNLPINICEPNIWLFGCLLPKRYWTRLIEWKACWLLDETNVERRRILIDLLGYEKICKDLNTTNIDIWREYTLLKIDNTDITYYSTIGQAGYHWNDLQPSYVEPIVLLKMTCPSTGHIHILRVPPQIVSAEAAITWVNHGIHPDRISFAT